MFGELDGAALAVEPATRITGQLQAIARRSHRASPLVKRHGHLIDRRWPSKQQHRHARQVAAIDGENPGRDIIEGRRFLLEAHDLAAHGPDEVIALFHERIFADIEPVRHGVALPSQQDPVKRHKLRKDRRRCS